MSLKDYLRIKLRFWCPNNQLPNTTPNQNKLQKQEIPNEAGMKKLMYFFFAGFVVAILSTVILAFQWQFSLLIYVNSFGLLGFLFVVFFTYFMNYYSKIASTHKLSGVLNNSFVKFAFPMLIMLFTIRIVSDPLRIWSGIGMVPIPITGFVSTLMLPLLAILIMERKRFTKKNWENPDNN